MIAAESLTALAPRIRDLGLSVVIGVPGDDVHVVANKLAEALLAAVGYEVTNVGVLVPEREFVAAALDRKPSALVLSSVNGHALMNCGQIPRALAEAGSSVPVYLGGNLSVGAGQWPQVERRFEALGFARVFPPHTRLPEGIGEISAELLRLSPARPLKTLHA